MIKDQNTPTNILDLDLNDIVHNALGETFCGDCEYPRCLGKVDTYKRALNAWKDEHVSQAVNKAYQKGYNDNSRDCYCDSPGATEGVLSHRHLADDGESHNIKPDINRGETPNQVEGEE